MDGKVTSVLLSSPYDSKDFLQKNIDSAELKCKPKKKQRMKKHQLITRTISNSTIIVEEKKTVFSKHI